MNLYASRILLVFFFFQAEDGIRDIGVTGVQTCALPISTSRSRSGESPCDSGRSITSERESRPTCSAKSSPTSSPTQLGIGSAGRGSPPSGGDLSGRGSQIGRASCRERV